LGDSIVFSAFLEMHHMLNSSGALDWGKIWSWIEQFNWWV